MQVGRFGGLVVEVIIGEGASDGACRISTEEVTRKTDRNKMLTPYNLFSGTITPQSRAPPDRSLAPTVVNVVDLNPSEDNCNIDNFDDGENNNNDKKFEPERGILSLLRTRGEGITMTITTGKGIGRTDWSR